MKLRRDDRSRRGAISLIPKNRRSDFWGTATAHVHAWGRLIYIPASSASSESGSDACRSALVGLAFAEPPQLPFGHLRRQLVFVLVAFPPPPVYVPAKRGSKTRRLSSGVASRGLIDARERHPFLSGRIGKVRRPSLAGLSAAERGVSGNRQPLCPIALGPLDVSASRPASPRAGHEPLEARNGTCKVHPRQESVKRPFGQSVSLMYACE